MWEYLSAALAGGAGAVIAKRYGKPVLDFLVELARKSIADKNTFEAKYPSIRQATNVNVLNSDNVVINVTAELFASGGFGISRESSVPIGAAMVSPQQRHSQVVKKLKRYLDPKACSAIVGAFALIRMENNPGTTFEAIDTLRRTRERLFSRDSDFRRRVYNDCKSGWVEDILFELAVDLEIQGRSRPEISEIVGEQFIKSVYHNPINVYVNDMVDDGQVFTKLRVKLQDEKRPLVRVYARGENWKRAVKTTSMFAEGIGYRHHREDRPIGRVDAGCCRIWNGELSPSWPELERNVEDELRSQMTR